MVPSLLSLARSASCRPPCAPAVDNAPTSLGYYPLAAPGPVSSKPAQVLLMGLKGGRPRTPNYVKRPRPSPAVDWPCSALSANRAWTGQVPRCVSATVTHRSTPVRQTGRRPGRSTDSARAPGRHRSTGRGWLWRRGCRSRPLGLAPQQRACAVLSTAHEWSNRRRPGPRSQGCTSRAASVVVVWPPVTVVGVALPGSGAFRCHSAVWVSVGSTKRSR